MKQVHVPRLCLLVLIGICGTFAVAARAGSRYYLKAGDRVVFYGDSITQQQFYTWDVEDYTLTRFPSLKVSFVNSGWGGDRVTGGGGGPIDLRLSRDVIAYRPTVVTSMLGMNDGGYRPFDEALYQTYTSGYEHIIQTLESRLPGVRITVIAPSAYDDVTRSPSFPGGYNSVLIRYSQFVDSLARRRNLTFADMNAPVVAGLQKANSLDPKLATLILPDRVHPRPAGHLWMAEALLKAWDAPGIVTNVVINARDGKVTRADNTRVTGLKTGQGMTWTQQDDALPLPLDFKDPMVSLALRSSNFMEALDQETLRVQDLKSSEYELKIDGKSVGAFSAKQLAQGINLAELETPMLDQAQAVHELTKEHNVIHLSRWRDIQAPLADRDFPEIPQAERALDRLEDKLCGLQQATAQPKLHHYKLAVQ